MTIWVVPGASRSEIKGLHGDAVKVRVAAPPEGGRANDEVRSLLSAATGLRAELVSGATSRRKEILLYGGHVAGVADAFAVEG